MKTSIWGPSAWTFLHAISFAFPDEPSEEHKEAALNLFSSLQLLLPCGDCCSHYCSTFQRKELSQHLESKDTFSRWLVNFHNMVNKRLRKPDFSYEQAKQHYLNDEATCAIQSPCGEDHITQLSTDGSHTANEFNSKQESRTGSSLNDPHLSSKENKESLFPFWLGLACVSLILFFLFMTRSKK